MNDMKASADDLLKLIGEQSVKLKLLEQENARLKLALGRLLPKPEPATNPLAALANGVAS